jgi:hypothetical protein
MMALLCLVACESGAGQTTAPPNEPVANAGDPPAGADKKTDKAEKPAPAREDNFTIDSSATSLEVGKAGELSISVKPKPGYKINLEFPWKAKLATAENFTVAALIGKDGWALDEKIASLKTPVTAAAAGDGEVNCKVSFSVCNEKACDVIRDHEVAVKVAAK